VILSYDSCKQISIDEFTSNSRTTWFVDPLLLQVYSNMFRVSLPTAAASGMFRVSLPTAAASVFSPTNL
jgi:hypothetical protein